VYDRPHIARMKRIRCDSILPLTVICLLLMAVSPIVRAQSQPELDALASEVATAISRSSTSPFRNAKVLVIDFASAHETPSELGEKFADAFSDSLSKNARGFVVMDRDEYLGSFAADKLDPQWYENPETMKCYADGLHATVVVDGDIDVLSDKVVVWVKALRTQDKMKIFDQRISLSPTAEMQAVISRAASSGTANATAGIPDAAKNGYSSPRCVECPTAHYSDAASQAKIQGTVMLAVVVGTGGSPVSVRVLKGLPCGLNQQAIDSVKKWKFQPATGPDGKLATTKVTAEVTFRLY
jgi:TonB family protein